MSCPNCKSGHVEIFEAIPDWVQKTEEVYLSIAGECTHFFYMRSREGEAPTQRYRRRCSCMCKDCGFEFDTVDSKWWCRLM